MKFNFMKKNAQKHDLKRMAKVLKVSRAGYYKFIHRTESKTKKQNRELVEKIVTIYQEKRKVYGSPRIHRDLKEMGEHCSRRRVAKLMQQNGIQAKTRRKWRTTKKAVNPAIAPNLLNQNFIVTEQNKVWLGDVTTIYAKEGYFHISAVMDLYSRYIVGLSMSSRNDSMLILKSLNQALKHRRPAAGLISHTDRGFQYTSHVSRYFAEEHKIRLSMSSKGNCYDNAPMESFFKTLKVELIYRKKYTTREEAMNDIFEYVQVFYNRQRSHSALGFMSPAEYEKRVQ